MCMFCSTERNFLSIYQKTFSKNKLTLLDKKKIFFVSAMIVLVSNSLLNIGPFFVFPLSLTQREDCRFDINLKNLRVVGKASNKKSISLADQILFGQM